ncbi:hypothetical protein SAMN05428945_6693 [Streptomyces sp. 2224.1]|uniref:DUF5955 family protein n=1 Tax=unclassified Streptomyces TaxID=2593676 RepID=UPI00088FF225|nr:hypothetical protein BX261_5874 [Streptomyces sp. 2321.6]SDR04292.1 hypothetical protein SAMN05216511_1385 [Streptomyces sp. KS_16]SED80855.1 hypothetical protein SAMN05428940_5901 [Streptomyces sp. 2133.1]SED94389.1 hypothetical protein SAMN05428954_1410 [Streptomyces sp. 2112.3]SEE18640.1 hypothetical protein SAMN05428945_6693 [Streptomyces sp. 2224.1]SNC72728.1 hypothetical protein SAMN06272741_5802 [Streptomyces sp. 2114.4]
MAERATALEDAVVVEQLQRDGRVAGVEDDPRVQELRGAVARLRRQLALLPGELADRVAADDELAALDAMVSHGLPEVPRLRRSLLLIAGAVGSVSALSPALTEVRAGIDRFGELPRSR